VKLGEAREAARQARLLIRQDIDPIEHRRRLKDERRKTSAERVLFRDAVKEFLTVHNPTWKSAKHAGQVKRSLEGSFKALGSRWVGTIDAAVINEYIAPIWTKTPATASRVKQRIETVVRWIKAGRPLPTKNGNGVKHFAAMAYVELPTFMAELQRRKGVAARALQFTVLTAARSAEALRATWDEIDLDAKVWTISGERMKSGRQHRVPLSDQALTILQTLPREGSWLFPGARPGKPLNNAAMLIVCKRMGRTDITTHGFRSTFTDWARERTVYSRDVVEMALAHAIKDKTEGAYRRGDALDKRTKLMQQWASHCYSPPVETNNVVRIGDAAA
jgi:integrase